MDPSIRVQPVLSPRDRRAFVMFPWQVYRGDPCWVPPLISDQVEYLEIVDLRTLRPLDMGPVLESFTKTNRAVIVEEGWRSYGVGSEVAARLYEQAFDYVDAPIQRVAQKEVPLPYNRNLEQMALPQVEDVIRAVKEVI